MWANIEINTYDDIHWDADSPSFKYEKLFYIENKNYAVYTNPIIEGSMNEWNIYENIQ